MKIDGLSFWKRIDSLLDAKKTNIKELSESINVGYYVLTTQRNRKTVPKIEELLSMSKFFDTDLEYMLTGNSSSRIITE